MLCFCLFQNGKGMKRRGVNERITFLAFCVMAFSMLPILHAPDIYAVQKKAMIGVDGWLIYTDKADVGNLLDYKKSGLFQEERLRSTGMRLDRFSEWLAEKKITFILTVAPNTPTIYPESIPKHIKVRGHISRLDQISRYLKENTNVNFLDLRPALLDAKKRHILYHKTGTHWNEVGAFIAYQELMRYMRQLRPADARQLTPMQLTDFNVKKKEYSGGLAKMMGLQGTLTEEVPVLRPKSAFTAARTWEEGKSLKTDNKRVCPGLSILVLKDSFFNNVQPYVSEHFCEATFIESLGIRKITVEVVQPDVVVWEIAERYLRYLKNVPDIP